MARGCVGEDVAVKAKGIKLTVENKAVLKPTLYKSLIYSIISETEMEEVRLKNMTIF